VLSKGAFCRRTSLPEHDPAANKNTNLHHALNGFGIERRLLALRDFPRCAGLIPGLPGQASAFDSKTN
jgi:hypothetical protein